MNNAPLYSWKSYLPFVIAGFLVFLVYELYAFIDGLLGAIILYVLLRPLMKRLIAKRWRKGLAAAVLMISSFIIIVIPILFMSYLIISKMMVAFSESASVVNGFHSFDERIKGLTGFELFSKDNVMILQQRATAYLTQIFGASLTILADLGVMYIVLYFMLISTGALEEGFNDYLPISNENIGLFAGELKAQTFSNALGVPSLGLIEGVFACIGYLIFGLHNPFFWGIMTGFFSFLPIVGSSVIWIPAGIYQLSVGATWQGVGILLFGLFVITTVDNVFRFTFQKHFANVHPLITIFGVIIGVQLFGLPGIIFGPLLLSWFVILMRIYKKDISVG
jgi:predicted PurR-regulated permease PerM